MSVNEVVLEVGVCVALLMFVGDIVLVHWERQDEEEDLDPDDLYDEIWSLERELGFPLSVRPDRPLDEELPPVVDTSIPMPGEPGAYRLECECGWRTNGSTVPLTKRVHEEHAERGRGFEHRIIRIWGAWEE